jgi:hypothetical protein
MHISEGRLAPALAGVGLRACQIASKSDLLFACKNDPPRVPECRVLVGFGALTGIGLPGRLERSEGVARPEFQPPQQQVHFPAGPGVSYGF